MRMNRKYTLFLTNVEQWAKVFTIHTLDDGHEVEGPHFIIGFDKNGLTLNVPGNATSVFCTVFLDVLFAIHQLEDRHKVSLDDLAFLLQNMGIEPTDRPEI